MLENLKPYPAYKDSGVEWLGKVPEHWGVQRIGNIVTLIVSNVDKHTKDGEIPVRLCNYSDVYNNERITSALDFMKATATPDEIQKYRLRKGDVIITKDSENWNDIGVPALVEYESHDLLCGYHLAILRPDANSAIGAFLLRALQSQQVAAQFHASANGVTRFGLSHGAIKNARIPLPPLPEQRVIAEFLDCETKKIDAAIEATKRSMELWEEFRTTLIAEVVTGTWDVREIARHLPEDEKEPTPEDESVPNSSPQMQPSAPEP